MDFRLPFDVIIQELLVEKLKAIEENFYADALVYCGPIISGYENYVRKLIEDLADDIGKRDKLLIILTTGGGSAETVERYVNIIRQHYNEVLFLVPDYAYSAGTIFCMSGDEIFMDYFSVLGPIDPQVQNKENRLIPALGYLDKVNEMLAKSAEGSLTQAEFMMLSNLDLGELRNYEQAKDLTISLLKKWLVQYKFKNWTIHETDPKKKGMPVTEKEKIERAGEIAECLGNNNLWKSHGRPINIEALRELKLKVQDYSNDPERSNVIREYHDLVTDFIVKNSVPLFIHSRNVR